MRRERCDRNSRRVSSGRFDRFRVMHKQYEKDMVKHLSNCVKYYGHTDESRVTAMVAQRLLL